jgi:diguanylate cyclase (GGDEF)-like protein
VVLQDLAFSPRRLPDLRAALFTAGNIPALIAVLVITAFGMFAEYQNNQVHRQSLRNDVLRDLSVIRAKLEGDINANLQLVRGLIAAISTEPQMNQQRFDQLAGNIFEQNSQLRSIAVAPDLVVTMTYPLAGNEAVIGLDYRTNELQREAALRVMETGQLVLAGPVELVQGGRGFVGRLPVYVGDSPSNRMFWGLVAAVIDVDRLYADAGLLDEGLPIDIAITGKDALGAIGTQFFGAAEVFRNDPVVTEAILPSGSWVLGAVPKTGWNVTPPNAWLLRGIIVLLGALVLFPMVVGGRLIEERARNLRALGSREAELQRLSRRLGLALETSQVGVWEYDIDSGDLHWDDRMNEIYGLPTDGRPRSYAQWRERLHPDDRERAAEDFRIAVEVTGHYRSDYRISTPDGEERSVRAIGRVYEDPGATPRIVGVNWDVTTDVALNDNLKRANRLSEARNAELEAAKQRIEHNALHDSLTGLPNRRYLDDILKRHAARCALNGRQLALLHIDLDRFKQINDTLGHAAGDAMLIHASEVLKSNIRAEDFVARIGGDEFVVVCAADGDTSLLSGLADRIIETMRQPVMYEGHECRFGVSVGIAVETGAQVDPQRLLINADIALYRAKSRGRNRYEFFTEALQAEVVNTKRVADEILNGLENAEFLPYYQPQFDAHTLDLVGTEALARWRHPSGRILPPVQFLDVAEELNVVSTIDRMILEQTLAQFEVWRAAGLEVPHVSVNVSARRLQDETLIENLKGLRIQPGMLSFELVESIFLDESDDIVLFNIDQIKDLGIDIEIDDFGTGYASIVSLLKLKPKRLKIDRQLVEPIVVSPPQRHLVESIIDIGKSLGIQVVGEGVETLEHAHILRDLGCDVLQGYAFAKPMAADDLSAFVRADAWRGTPLNGPYGSRNGNRRGATR